MTAKCNSTANDKLINNNKLLHNNHNKFNGLSLQYFHVIKPGKAKTQRAIWIFLIWSWIEVEVFEVEVS